MLLSYYTWLKSIFHIPQMDSASHEKKWYETYVEKAKNFEFNEPVEKSNKEFWRGIGSKIVYQDGTETQCILHINTNLAITYDGELLGRHTNEGFIPVEKLEVKIVDWYYNGCGFYRDI